MARRPGHTGASAVIPSGIAAVSSQEIPVFSRPRSASIIAALAVVAIATGGAPTSAAPKKKATKQPKVTVAPSTAAPVAPKPVVPVVPANSVTIDGISPERCEANKKAGKITYLSGFDYAATASIVEMIVADAKGYFAKMCLDVDVKASFSTANYALVADNKAQFASAGSYVEVLRNSPKEKPLVVAYNLGKTAIDGLMVRDDVIKGLRDLRGKVIGMKGDIPPSIVAMLNSVGLKRGSDYTDKLVEGFNPVAHFQLPIDALPGFKSNEPGQLDRAGIAYKLFDPTAYGIPGSFGLIYTNPKFLKENPTAAQDFVRAALYGYADSVNDIDGAVDLAVKRINANGNRNFLSPVGERFRWRVEAKIVADNTPVGTAVGLIIPKLLQEQVDAYTEAGVFTTKPLIVGTYDDSLVKSVIGPDNQVIWPKK
jgi:ABC-type nitrate/sulfonate/bicarbonate transport system substrate-binding protein